MVSEVILNLYRPQGLPKPWNLQQH